MPYLEAEKTNDIAEEKIQVEMPDISGLTVKEAKKILKNLKLDYETDIESEDEIIKDQLPKRGIMVDEGTKIIIY